MGTKDATVSHLNVVPPIALQLLSNPLASTGDYSTLKCLMNAAAPLEQSLADQLCQKLTCCLTQWYGLTEASPSVISQTEDQVHIRNTVGKILPGMTVKILDENFQGTSKNICKIFTDSKLQNANIACQVSFAFEVRMSCKGM